MVVVAVGTEVGLLGAGVNIRSYDYYYIASIIVV